jgi:glycolate oxidase FAD binding subunit
LSIEGFRQQILEGLPLRIRGGGTKNFYGGPLTGVLLNTTPHTGIISYEPTELVLTARAGTPIHDIREALIENEQHLYSSPPFFGFDATLGGYVASGLGDQYRKRGSVREGVLGITLMDGEGRVQRFGGNVIKNVAGFDISRLMVGAMGTLGLILDVTLRVTAAPPDLEFRTFEMPQAQALETMNRWLTQGLPVEAACWHEGILRVEFGGVRKVVEAAAKLVGPGVEDEYDGFSENDPKGNFWDRLSSWQLDFFDGDEPLWRLSVPSTTPVLDLPGPVLIDWCGAQRWFRGDIDVVAMREMAARVGGHLTRYRGGDRRIPAFQRPPEPVMDIHRRLKRIFDPRGVFNPGRLYPDF